MKENVIDKETPATNPEPEFSGFTRKSGNITFLVGLHFSKGVCEKISVNRISCDRIYA